MLLILLSWILLFFIFLSYGLFVQNVLKIKKQNLIYVLLFGMIFQTVALTFCAFFIALNYKLFIVNCLLSTIITFYYKTNFVLYCQKIKSNFKNLSPYSKLTFILIFILALLKCAQKPFILDNESYYIQTIKWLNQYGFIKGLGNFNIAFGQTSGWHILQSGFNFSFLFDRLNDINGFLLIIISFYCVTKFDKNKRNNSRNWLVFILSFNVLSFQFINSPSPDFAIYCISQLIFYLFTKNKTSISNYKIIILLFAFLVFLKIIMAPFALIILYCIVKKPKLIPFFIFIMAFFSVLFVAKNIVLTGYPLFPLMVFETNFDWKIPKNLIQSFAYILKNHKFLKIKNYTNFTFLEKFKTWFFLPGISGLFNKTTILLFIIAPFTKVVQSNKKYLYLYIALLLHFIIIYCFSPQFRFYLTEIIFLSIIIVFDIVNKLKINKKHLQILLLCSCSLPFFVFFQSSFKMATTNKLNQENDRLKWLQIYLPEPNSKYENSKFIAYTVGNLTYYSPQPNYFFYATGNGVLPCTNYKIIKYNQKQTQFVPQLRTGILKDGFCSKTTTP